MKKWRNKVSWTGLSLGQKLVSYNTRTRTKKHDVRLGCWLILNLVTEPGEEMTSIRNNWPHDSPTEELESWTNGIRLFRSGLQPCQKGADGGFWSRRPESECDTESGEEVAEIRINPPASPSTQELDCLHIHWIRVNIWLAFPLIIY